jgi:hypothetical protein
VNCNLLRILPPVALLVFASCGVGDGSEIGPALPILPDDSCKVSVFDDDGRAVTGASVAISSRTALTGRSGRGDFFANPRGRVLVDIDGSEAAAAAADRLAGYRVAATIAREDLPAPLYLPRLGDNTLALPVGTQSAAATLASVAGNRVTVPVGCSVGSAVATVVELRVGDLAPHHLPGDPPASGANALLWSRGLLIAAADATFAPGLSLDIANDFGSIGAPQIWRLGAATGEWVRLEASTSATATRLLATGVVTVPGLYAFAIEVPATTALGRVIDTAGEPLRQIQVGVDNSWSATDDQGRFAIAGVAATRGNGSPRQAVLTLAAGGIWLPARAETIIDVAVATVDLGDRTFDTAFGGDVRVQAIVRGRANAFTPVRLSAQDRDVFVTATCDANGQARLEGVPAGFLGTQDGRPLDNREVLYGQATAFLDRGRRRDDVLLFQQRRAWWQGSRRARAYACDAIGGGPLRDAFVIQGAAAGQGLAGTTSDGGQLFVTRNFEGRATVVRRSQREGRELVHAFSIVSPDGDNLEFPLQRLWQTPLGAFDRHGLVAGTIIGAVPSRQHALRSTRRLSLQEWWDEVVDGVPIPSSLPIDVDPAVTHGPFVAGVDATGGNLVAIETTSIAGLTAMQAVAVLADLQPVEGARIERDLTLLPATTPFDVPGAETTLPPEVNLSNLRIDLALRQPSGRLVDVARGLANFQFFGTLRCQLPELSGELAGHEWLAMLTGLQVANDRTFSVRSLCVLRPQNSPALVPIAMPNLIAPLPNANLPASGFAVDFTLPPGCVHGQLELRSTTSDRTLLWQALLPPNATRFEFVPLPTAAPAPIVAGRAYTLTLTAYADAGILAGSENVYRDLSTFWQSIGPAERGVRGVARVSIPLTTF